nr:HPr family phosphocarrier protein [Propioniciclava soli]
MGAGSAEVDAGQAPSSGARVLELRIDLPHGLHARPAAAIASALAPFDAQVTLQNVTRGGDSTEADSPMGILALGVRQGDVVEATVDGPDADAAAAALQTLADAGFGES